VLIDATWLDSFSPNLPIFRAALEMPLLILLLSSLDRGLLDLLSPELPLEESSFATTKVLGVVAGVVVGVDVGVDVGVGAALLFETEVASLEAESLTDRGVVDVLDFSSALDFFRRIITTSFCLSILFCRTSFGLLVGVV